MGRYNSVLLIICTLDYIKYVCVTHNRLDSVKTIARQNYYVTKKWKAEDETGFVIRHVESNLLLGAKSRTTHTLGG